jgi:hypothetical protein
MTDKVTDQRSAAFEIPDEIRVTLKKPITKAATRGADGEGEKLTELSFRPPTVGEMKQISRRRREQDGDAAAILMLSLLSNDKLTPPDVERMSLIDAQICQEALEPFLVLKDLSKAD